MNNFIALLKGRAWGRALHSPSVSFKIFDLLCDHPYGLTAKQLAEQVWTADDGGPDWWNSSIQVSVLRINRLAQACGIGLRVRGSGGPGSRYQIWVVRP